MREAFLAGLSAGVLLGMGVAGFIYAVARAQDERRIGMARSRADHPAGKQRLNTVSVKQPLYDRTQEESPI